MTKPVQDENGDPPDVICGACGKPKAPALFTPSQLSRKDPHCRVCRGKKK